MADGKRKSRDNLAIRSRELLLLWLKYKWLFTAGVKTLQLLAFTPYVVHYMCGRVVFGLQPQCDSLLIFTLKCVAKIWPSGIIMCRDN